ncbi:MAG: hypothetical protein ACTSXC_07265 [Candidatus Freyarchaeota archaeon]
MQFNFKKLLKNLYELKDLTKRIYSSAKQNPFVFPAATLSLSYLIFELSAPSSLVSFVESSFYLDKLAHIAYGYMLSDVGRMIKEIKKNKQTSELSYSLGFITLGSITKELFDEFVIPKWGFDVYDFISTWLGFVFHQLQRYIKRKTN